MLKYRIYMNFNVDNSTSIGVIPTSNNNYIGIVYSNVLKTSLDTYLPLAGGELTGNLIATTVNTSGNVGIGTSLNSLNILNVNSFINVSSNITANSNIITSNINSITNTNSGLLKTSSLNTGPIIFTNSLTQQNTEAINNNKLPMGIYSSNSVSMYASIRY